MQITSLYREYQQVDMQGTIKLFKIFHILGHLNDKFKTLHMLNQNIMADKSVDMSLET